MSPRPAHIYICILFGNLAVLFYLIYKIVIIYYFWLWLVSLQSINDMTVCMLYICKWKLIVFFIFYLSFNSTGWLIVYSAGQMIFSRALLFFFFLSFNKFIITTIYYEQKRLIEKNSKYFCCAVYNVYFKF